MAYKDKLNCYEVLIGLFENYFNRAKKRTIILKSKERLYEVVNSLCKSDNNIFPLFEFRNRSGILTSSDIDLSIRNLKDSGNLSYINFELEEYKGTDLMKRAYEDRIKPKLKKFGCLSKIKKISEILV